MVEEEPVCKVNAVGIPSRKVHAVECCIHHGVVLAAPSHREEFLDHIIGEALGGAT
jgi:hypothetical protein